MFGNDGNILQFFYPPVIDFAKLEEGRESDKSYSMNSLISHHKKLQTEYTKHAKQQQTLRATTRVELLRSMLMIYTNFVKDMRVIMAHSDS